MANAAVWWSDSSMSVSGSISRPNHFAGHALGAPRTPRPAASAPESVGSIQAVSSSRNDPTALVHGKGYRRGAEAPQKSSLPFFVLIGLAVGLFAFGMMTFCLPDPFEKMAAREAAAQTFPAPVFKPVEAAPPPIAEVVEAAPAPATALPATATKAHPARRHHVAAKKPAAKTASLPSNPYTL